MMHTLISILLLAFAGKIAAADTPVVPDIGEQVTRQLDMNELSFGNIAACQRIDRIYAGKTEKLLAASYRLNRAAGNRDRQFPRQYRIRLRKAAERQADFLGWRIDQQANSPSRKSVEEECKLYSAIFEADMRATKALTDKLSNPSRSKPAR